MYHCIWTDHCISMPVVGETCRYLQAQYFEIIRQLKMGGGGGCWNLICFHVCFVTNTHKCDLTITLYVVKRTKSSVETKNVNTLRPRQNGRHFADDIFKSIFLNKNVWIPIKISLKFVPKGPINNIPALVQIMDWRRPGDKPLSEPMMAGFTDAYMRRPVSKS